jgi:anti-sigma B factor antagonist
METTMRPGFTIVRLPSDHGSLAVRGEIDICTAPDLRDGLRDAVRAATRGTVVTADLSAVSFIDSCGLTTLVEAEAYATVRGIRLVFAGVPASITRLLTITGLSLSRPEAS